MGLVGVRTTEWEACSEPRYGWIVIGGQHDITSSASNHEEPFVDLLFQASILGNLASSKVRFGG
jgi:hypothetical protein